MNPTTDHPFDTGAREASSERVFVESVAGAILEDNPMEQLLHDLCAREIVRNIRSDTHALELGCGNGTITEALYDGPCSSLCVVDGAKSCLDAAKARLGEDAEVSFYHCLFEEFTPDRQFHDIVACTILEHVKDPEALLLRVRDWLKPGGRLHIVVPNALSLHRRVGCALGMLPTPYSLAPSDLKIGHRRVYDPCLLQAHVTRAGLDLVHLQGIMFKPLSYAQMQDWDREAIIAMHECMCDRPETCACLYVIAERGVACR